MAKEWTVKCKDCDKEFGYSDWSNQAEEKRGHSRPERCSDCRKTHNRQTAQTGLSYFDLTPHKATQQRNVTVGGLGALHHSPREHKSIDHPSHFDPEKFGLKDENVRELFDWLSDPKHQVAIVEGPTGSGKSTALPFRLIDPPEGLLKDQFTRHGQIVVTQPRIQATRNIPAYVAKELYGSSLGSGFDIGFRYSNHPFSDWRNRLVYITDGTLINWIVNGQIVNLSVVMIDEAHERSLNIDLILALLKKLLPRYPHLKLIIASATIDSRRFAEYFGEETAKVIAFSEKRKHKFDTIYCPDNERLPYEDLPRLRKQIVEALAKKVVWVLEETVGTEKKGDILAFLQGEKPIEEAVKKIKQAVKNNKKLSAIVDIYPLYTTLSQPDQNKALLEKENPEKTRVVVTTNVAETSLTVEGVVYVVDSGLINEARWNPESQTKEVVTVLHSQAGCQQRWGRAGRTKPGIAYCLYTKKQFLDEKLFPKYTTPQIQRSALDQIVLTAKAAGIDNLDDLDWIEKLPAKELARAPQALQKIGALDEKGDLTEHGLELQMFADEPVLANLMTYADRFACAVEMATLIPMLKAGGMRHLLKRERNWTAHTSRAVAKIHQSMMKGCRDDIEFCLKLYAAWSEAIPSPESWAKTYFINHNLLIDKIEDGKKKLLEALSGHKKEANVRRVDFDLLDKIRIIFAYCLKDRIYVKETKPDDKTNKDIQQETAVFKRYFFDGEQNNKQEMVVQVNEDSVCYKRQIEAFTCGKQQVITRRITPQSSPAPVMAVSYLAMIENNWLEWFKKKKPSNISLGCFIADQTRDKDSGKLISSTTFTRLFLDQKIPLGSRHEYQVEAIEDKRVKVKLLSLLANRSEIKESFKRDEPDEDREMSGDIDADGEAGELVDTVLNEKKDVLIPNPDEEVIPTWVDLSNYGDENISEPPKINSVLNRIQPHEFACYLKNGNVKYRVGDIFPVEVTDYDFPDADLPSVIACPVKSQDAFDLFRKHFQNGDTVTVEVSEYDERPGGHLISLVVKEPESEFEIVMEPEQVSFTTRGFALKEIPIGTKIQTIIEDIDQESKRVKLCALKFTETHLNEFISREKKKIDVVGTPGVVGELTQDRVFFKLLVSEPERGFIHIVGIGGRGLHQKVELYQIGDPYTLRVWFPHKPFRKDLPQPANEIKAAVEEIGKELALSWEKGTLSIRGRMTYDIRNKLQLEIKDKAYWRTIDDLYRISNQFMAEVVDLEKEKEILERKKKYLPGVKVTDAKVLRVANFGAFVELEERIEGMVHNSEMGKIPVKEGDLITVTVVKIRMDLGEIGLSICRPFVLRLTAPVENKRLLIGGNREVINGIRKETDAGVDIDDDENITVWADSEEKLISAQKRIQEILTPCTNTLTIPVERIGRAIGSKGGTIEPIKFKTHTHITINNQTGEITVEGSNKKDVESAIQMIKEEARLYKLTIMIPKSKVGDFIGKGGNNINMIRNKTATDINVDTTRVITVRKFLFSEEWVEVAIWGSSDEKTALAVQHIRNRIPEAKIN